MERVEELKQAVSNLTNLFKLAIDNLSQARGITMPSDNQMSISEFKSLANELTYDIKRQVKFLELDIIKEVNDNVMENLTIKDIIEHHIRKSLSLEQNDYDDGSLRSIDLKWEDSWIG